MRKLTWIYMDEDDTNVEPMFDYHGFDEGYNIDSLEDIGMIEFWNIRDEDVCHFDFSDVDIAFEFYNRYARTRGFSARKNRTRKSRAGALKLKNFVCHREGFRPPNNYGIGNLKRKPTPETRCGCSAMMEIRVDAPSGRWFISYFSDEHNHPLLDPRLTGLLPGHRFMSEADIGHMVNMKKGGISVGQIYRALANQAGGYEYLFHAKGHVVATTTEGGNEWEAPVSVITDGDLLMKFAIEKEFPNAHHRLCAWHLIRNATSNIGKPQFTSVFRKCMLGDYEIDVFRQKWFEMVEGFGVENKNWVLDMYKKRHSWATAHIRRKFFAGFRTTSRCEGLNLIIAKYVNSRYNLVEFIQHFNRCVDHIRWKEVQADLASVNGRPSMQTCFQQLERSDANVYTLSIFHMFQPIFVRAASMKVINMRQTGSYVIYSVGLDQTPNEMWRVFYTKKLI
ncbi:protein FAR1-RELATED SEQUENCE 5-like [Arachis hypogaea]|uniref:protein FAR1-RELATED SEQUENCE 5-like n=1 Tax=Arachis hypogaea TaxID=3818 RepID=UPI003B20E648